jgi:YD repeat-containing protein
MNASRGRFARRHSPKNARSGRRSIRARRRMLVEYLEDRTLPSVSWAVNHDGYWDDPSNWSGGTVPGAGDDVVIDQPGPLTITVRDGRSVQSITGVNSNDALAITGNLTVTAASSLSGPLELESGSFSAGAAFTLTSTDSEWTGGVLQGHVINQGTITLSGGNDKALGWLTLDNAGTIVQTGAGNLTGGTYGGGQQFTFNNLAGGVYDFQSDSSFVMQYSGSGTLNNTGILRKSAGTGTSSIGWNVPFCNLGGTIDVQTGQLTLAGNGTSTGGTFTVAAGAVLNLTPGASGTYSGTYTGSGGGTVQLSGGTLTAGAGATVAFPAGMFQWTGGDLQGTLTNTGTLTLFGSGDKPLGDGAVLNNAGTIVQADSGNLVNEQGATATVNNQPGGVYVFQSDAGIFTRPYGSLVFNNAGTLRKSAGAGTSTIVWANTFNNQAGTIDVQSGDLNVQAGGTSTGGTFNAAAGAVLDWTTNNTQQTWGGTYTGSGQGAVRLNTTLNSSAATLNFPAGLLQWVGGSLQGTVTNAGTLTLSGSSTVTLMGVLDNAGTIIQKDAATLAGSRYGYGDHYELHNLAGALYDLQGTGGISNSWTGDGTITNAGTFRKSMDPGSVQVSSSRGFDNVGGVVDVEAGTLQLGSWYEQGNASTGGTFTVAASAVLDLTGGGTSAYTGSYTGSGGGTVQLSSGTLDATGGVTFNFPAGLFQWSGGVLQGTVTNTGTMALSGSNTLILMGIVNNAGTIIQTDAAVLQGGRYAYGDHYELHNLAGALYDLQGTGGITNSYSGNGTITNAGTFRKSVNPNGVQVSSASGFDNLGGVIDVEAGTLVLGSWYASGNASTGGEFTVAGGAVLDLTGGGTATYTGSYTGSGGGTVQLSSGALIGVSGTSFDLPAGMLQWTGGDLQGTVTNNGTLTIAGSGDKVLSNGAVLNNACSIVQADTGNLMADQGASATINNLGGAVYDFRSDAGISHRAYGSLAFNNAGTLRKSAGTGSATIDWANTFNNPTGTVDVESGTLNLSNVVQVSGSTLTGGTWSVAGNATLNVSGAVTVNQASVILNGTGASFPAVSGLTTNSGTFSILDGASFTTAGDLANSGTLTVGPGSTLQVTGNFTQSPAGTLAVQVGGTPASGRFGRLAVGGTAAWDGTLDVQLVNGFGPTSGQTYTIAIAAGSSGHFATVLGLTAGRFPVFTLTTNPTSLALNAVTSAPDLVVTAIGSIPATGAPGQSAGIPYTVANQSGTPAAGTWVDSVYLTPSGQIGDATLIGRVTHTGDGTTNPYTVTLNDPLPAMHDGYYHVLVMADSRGLVPDLNRANNVLVSASTVNVTTPVLPLSTAVPGTLAAGQDAYYRLDLAAGQDVLLNVHGAAGMAQLYESYGGFPDSTTYDATVTLTGPAAQLLVPAPQAGSCYVLLHGLAGAAGGQAYTLEADPIAFQVQTVSPAYGSNQGQAVLTLVGTQFTPQSAVALLGPGGTSRTASAVQYKDGNTLFATFDLTGLTAGTYDVRVSNGSQQATLPGGFAVNAAPAGRVQVFITGPSYIRPGWIANLTITYVNTGSTAVPAPILFLTSDNGEFRLPGQTTWVPNSFQVLAINQSGPAGMLPAGYHGQMQVQMVPRTFGAHVVSNYNVSLADPTASVDWAGLKASLRPSTISSAAWDAIYPNFLARVGTTYGQLQAALDQDATYLSTLGETVGGVRDLLSLEYLQADGLGNIHLRYRLGAMGWLFDDPTRMTAAADASGNVTVTYPSGLLRIFLIQPNGSYIGAPGNAAQLTLSNGVYTLRETDGRVFVFRPDGKLDHYDLPGGPRWTAQYDAGGRLTAYTSSTGAQMTYTYNAQGRISQFTDQTGAPYTLTYDPTGQYLLSIAGPAGTYQYSYLTGQGPQTQNALASITRPDGSHRYFTYDSLGRLTGCSGDGGADALTYAYPSPGVLTITTAAGATTTYDLNESWQLVRVIEPTGTSVNFGNQVLTEVQPDGATLVVKFDKGGRPTTVVDPLGNTLQMTYDPTTGELVTYQDQNGNTRSLTWNGSGNLVALTYPGGLQEQFGYDAGGREVSYTDRGGQTTRHTYNAAGLVAEKDYPDGTHVSYVYNAQNLMTSSTDAAGTTTYSYDSFGRLTGVSYPNGLSLSYTYDAAGRRTQLVDQTGFTTNYAYDALGRLSKLTDGSGALIVAYTYDANGLVVRQDAGNGTSTTYAYDGNGNCLSIVNYAPGGTVSSRLDYTYDAEGRPVSQTLASGTWTYQYDADGQLVHAVFASTDPAVPSEDLTYQYDAAGNRVKVIQNGAATDYVSNGLDEYLSAGTTTYAYDADGRLVGMQTAAGNWSYSYDDEGRLTAVTSPQGTWAYRYDALGDRVAVTHNGQTVQYLVDPTGIGSVAGEFGSGGQVVAHYTYGLAPASRTDALGQAAYYAFDAQGNTVALTGAGGAVLNRLRLRAVRADPAQERDRREPVPVRGAAGHQQRRQRPGLHAGPLLFAGRRALPHPRPAALDRVGGLHLRRQQPDGVRRPAGLEQRRRQPPGHGRQPPGHGRGAGGLPEPQRRPRAADGRRRQQRDERAADDVVRPALVGLLERDHQLRDGAGHHDSDGHGRERGANRRRGDGRGNHLPQVLERHWRAVGEPHGQSVGRRGGRRCWRRLGRGRPGWRSRQWERRRIRRRSERRGKRRRLWRVLPADRAWRPQRPGRPGRLRRRRLPAPRADAALHHPLRERAHRHRPGPDCQGQRDARPQSRSGHLRPGRDRLR